MRNCGERDYGYECRSTAERIVEGRVDQPTRLLGSTLEWADEAKTRFERALVNGWEYDEDPPADHLFGSYYHWCALLCGFSEAALDQGLLSESQLDGLRRDIETCLPKLRACRQLLVVIPMSREEDPRLVDLLRDDETLDRLRRVHGAFGEALREEQLSRALDFLDVHER